MASQPGVRLPSPVVLIQATQPILRSRVGRLEAFWWDSGRRLLRGARLVTLSLDMSWANPELLGLIG
jgi:hypothetical protein